MRIYASFAIFCQSLSSDTSRSPGPRDVTCAPTVKVFFLSLQPPYSESPRATLPHLYLFYGFTNCHGVLFVPYAHITGTQPLMITNPSHPPGIKGLPDSVSGKIW